MSNRYAPPYRITPGILNSIERIGEALGNLRAHWDSAIVPILRRGNRIKTIQASLAIEGNTLSLEQVTALIAGKRVLAPPREIQEVRNAILRAIEEAAILSDQESDYQSDQVIRLLRALRKTQRNASDLMTELGLAHRPTFRKNYLHPALAAGLIEMTQPDTPRARNQKYRLTARGKQLVDKIGQARGPENDGQARGPAPTGTF